MPEIIELYGDGALMRFCGQEVAVRTKRDEMLLDSGLVATVVRLDEPDWPNSAVAAIIEIPPARRGRKRRIVTER